MTTSASPNEGPWRAIFLDGDPKLAGMQRFNAKLPAPPRCRLCYAPFGGLGGMYLRWRGKAPAIRNPNFCNACDRFLEAYPGGTEVPLSMVFVDVRGSTATAAEKSPSALKDYMEDFFRSARNVLFETDGFVAEYRGDCVVGTYPPGLSGADHARKAIEAAKLLLGKGAPRKPDGSIMPIGIGVHTGPVYIGTIGGLQGANRQDVSILGDNVNVAAILSHMANPGEALVSVETGMQGGLADRALECRDVPIKGRPDHQRAYVLT